MHQAPPPQPGKGPDEEASLTSKILSGMNGLNGEEEERCWRRSWSLSAASASVSAPSFFALFFFSPFRACRGGGGRPLRNRSSAESLPMTWTRIVASASSLEEPVAGFENSQKETGGSTGGRRNEELGEEREGEEEG